MSVGMLHGICSLSADLPFPNKPRLRLELRPHLERGGAHHTERFDACLNGEVICTSRSGWHEPVRALLVRGCPPDTLLHVQHAGRPFDPTIQPQPIGELAKWTISERDRGGLTRQRWAPYPADQKVAHSSLVPSGAGAAGLAA